MPALVQELIPASLALPNEQSLLLPPRFLRGKHPEDTCTPSSLCSLQMPSAGTDSQLLAHPPPSPAHQEPTGTAHAAAVPHFCRASRAFGAACTSGTCTHPLCPNRSCRKLVGTPSSPHHIRHAQWLLPTGPEAEGTGRTGHPLTCAWWLCHLHPSSFSPQPRAGSTGTRGTTQVVFHCTSTLPRSPQSVAKENSFNLGFVLGFSPPSIYHQGSLSPDRGPHTPAVTSPPGTRGPREAPESLSPRSEGSE